MRSCSVAAVACALRKVLLDGGGRRLELKCCHQFLAIYVVQSLGIHLLLAMETPIWTIQNIDSKHRPSSPLKQLIGIKGSAENQDKRRFSKRQATIGNQLIGNHPSFKHRPGCGFQFILEKSKRNSIEGRVPSAIAVWRKNTMWARWFARTSCSSEGGSQIHPTCI